MDFVSTFGLTSDELKLTADTVLRSETEVRAYFNPKSPPQMKMIYVSGDTTFDDDTPLKGSGILIVEGDLTLAQCTLTAGHFFSGIVYVTGYADIHEPTNISGAVLTGNGLNVAQGATAEFVSISYDAELVENAIGLQLTRYRPVNSELHLKKNYWTLP